MRKQPKMHKGWGVYDGLGRCIVLAMSRSEARAAQRAEALPEERLYVHRVKVHPKKDTPRSR